MEKPSDFHLTTQQLDNLTTEARGPDLIVPVQTGRTGEVCLGGFYKIRHFPGCDIMQLPFFTIVILLLEHRMRLPHRLSQQHSLIGRHTAMGMHLDEHPIRPPSHMDVLTHP